MAIKRIAPQEPLPPFQYLHRAVDNPLDKLLFRAVTGNREALADVRNTPFRKSVEAERIIAEDLKKIGFLHSVTNRKCANLFNKGLNFEVDFFHPQLQIAIEVEKGEVNNIWKNICKFAESPLIRHGVLLVPVIRQGQQNATEYYNKTVKRLSCLERVYSLIDSLLIIGY
ncbi:MAG: hypothetical protein N2491_02915 [Negativicutes bacterium]|nr:hypothetical protein [Negativicutes bacterium]